MLELSLEDLAALFAVCVGTGVDVVSDKGTKGDSATDMLASTLGLDMRNWWKPTAESYFMQVPKGLSLEAMQVVAPAEVARLTTLKKGDLASEAGRLAEGMAADDPHQPRTAGIGGTMTQRAAPLMWRHSLRWCLPHKPCPGLRELLISSNCD
ncbi:hypothetical protein E8F20_12230 [Pseudomonas sp. BN415]|uniref:hypothetical protein n=1 Tax=Pseudomonas sp. BN415 TaxID=2567889 RepID=UPI002457F01D|nr:hypothetical protein [Pseudomonas sp. BN415]MDH4582629.1 hypothetical protein [Pseudomonas sp. BN415]